MASALVIGRAQTLADPGLWGIRSWDIAGNDVTVSGVLYAPGITDAKTLRQQIIGHAEDGDDEVVPVTWAADPSVDGYYRVRSAAVNMEGSSLATGRFAVALRLERVAGYAAPVWESALIGATLTNAHSVTGIPAWHAVPDVVTGYAHSLVTHLYQVGSADGTMQQTFFSSHAVTPRYRLAPTSFYVGAAKLEMVDANAAYQVVGGRQVPNDPDGWRLSNGIVRVVPSTGAKLIVEVWDGVAWSAALTYRLETIDLTPDYQSGNFLTMTVLRNGPEEVVIRTTFTLTSAGGAITLDLALRRGERMVRGYVQSHVAREWKIMRDSVDAATDLGFGTIKRSTDDAAGNRYVLVSPQAVTADTTNGGLKLTAAATRLTFAIGLELNSATAVAPEYVIGDRGLGAQFFAAQSERMGLAGR